VNQRFRACGYAPMVELLRYLEAHGFTAGKEKNWK